ncbi:MAG: ATP-binding protein [Polyangiaceae bacterium]
MESAEEALGTLATLASLAALTHHDPLAVAGAVRRCGDRLRDGVLDSEVLRALVDRIALLSKDASPRVRQSVAEAAAYLPEPAFQEIVPSLAKDRSPYVREAAEQAARRRATLRRVAAADEEHDARVEGWYREIDRRGARAAARRIAAHETEYFVRRMVHETGATFMDFKMAATHLREAVDAPEIDRARVRALADRLQERFAFFQRVLETGRMHSRPVEPDLRREDVAALVADEASLLGGRFPDRAGRIDVDLSGLERPLVIDGDASFLRQAFGNILKNAVEAYDGGAESHERAIRIVVTGRASAIDVTVTVRDFGAGMHERDVARAFVPFGSSKPGGTGFGLYIARRVARAVHGGDLTLASTLGEGTTVTMTLPLRQESGARRGATKRKRA